jgi:hypothetical protein
MTDLSTTLRRASRASRLDRIIRNVEADNGALGRWSATERHWFASLVHPFSSLSDEGGFRLTPSPDAGSEDSRALIDALMREVHVAEDKTALLGKLEHVPGLWKKLGDGAEPFTAEEVGSFLWLARLLRRHFLGDRTVPMNTQGLRT